MVIHFISVLNILCQSRDQTSRRRYSVLSPSVGPGLHFTGTSFFVVKFVIYSTWWTKLAARLLLTAVQIKYITACYTMMLMIKNMKLNRIGQF